MKIIKIEIRNMLAFDDAAFAFETDGLTAIIGPNGSGKSTLIEAVCAALWRQWPSRPSRRGLIAGSRSKDARLAVELEYRRSRYRIEHHVDALAEKAQASMYVWMIDHWEALVVGKLGDFDAKIREIFPDDALFVASIFSAQNGLGSFAKMGTAERRVLFAKLLGLERMAALQAKSKKKREESDAAIALARASLDAIGAVGVDRSYEIEALKGRIEALKGERAVFATALDVSIARNSAIEADRKAHREALARHNRAVIEIAGLRAKIDATAFEVGSIERESWSSTPDRMIDARAEYARAKTANDANAKAWLEAKQRSDRARALLASVPCGGAGDYAGCPLISDAVRTGSEINEPPKQQDLTALMDAVRREEAAYQAGQKRAALLSDIRQWNAKIEALTKHEAPQEPTGLTVDLDADRARLRAIDQQMADLSRVLGGMEQSQNHRLMHLAKKEDLSKKLDDATIERKPWVLLEKALGKEGVQALSIDAAAPAISEIATQLLRACYGSRFAVELSTLREAEGNRQQREVFDLLVHDGDRGTSTPFDELSGGEKVIVDEALKLAIAVFASAQMGDIATLWRDECDGDLDERRAALYPTMLRKAMEIGGFSRCVFISHRESVWSQADDIVDLAKR